ncbi:AbiU2 domain-containing protein [Ruegeria intermedia]|uniref:AbiU2 domain-containing protein n=1 Tax=Ruegeria intermedia TaxID=996115 RepID=UPI00122C3FA4|nr:hypothetical protein [Ruegeria intermedia]
MTTNPSEAALAEKIEKLGDEFGRLFADVQNDLFTLRLHWRVYKALFATNSERVDLLNSVSGTTAWLLERTLFETAVMSVCRLTDPPASIRGKQKNITIQRFPSLAEERLGLEGVEGLVGIVNTAVDASEFARSWRNKRLAHSDEAVRRGQQAVLDASVEKMDYAIDAVASVIHWVGVELMDVEIITHPISSYGSDEVVLLEALFLGQKERKRRRERAQNMAREGLFEDAERLLAGLPNWLTYREPDKLE